MSDFFENNKYHFKSFPNRPFQIDNIYLIEDGKVMTFGIGDEVEMLNFEDKKCMDPIPTILPDVLKDEGLINVSTKPIINVVTLCTHNSPKFIKYFPCNDSHKRLTEDLKDHDSHKRLTEDLKDHDSVKTYKFKSDLLTKPENPICCITTLHNMIVFSGCDGFLNFAFANDDEIEHHCRTKLNESCTKFLVLSPNNELVSSTSPGDIKLQQVGSWAPHSSYKVPYKCAIQSIDINDKNEVLFTTSRYNCGKLQILDKDLQKAIMLDDHDLSIVNGAKFINEHHIISSCCRAVTKLWDIRKPNNSIVISDEYVKSFHNVCSQSTFVYCQETKKVIVGSMFNTLDVFDLSTIV